MIDPTSLTFLVVVILLALIFEFANGFNDAANAIATVVSTRVMSPLTAVAMAGVMNFLGAISGTAVAKAVGKGVVDPDGITLLTVASGVAAAAIWVLLASRLGMPVSGSHSLIAGVAGAGIAQAGFGVLVWTGIRKILLGLFFSPLLGFTGGFLIPPKRGITIGSGGARTPGGVPAGAFTGWFGLPRTHTRKSPRS